MKAIDFITQVRVELDEKTTKHWSDEELLIKLQRSYVAIQKDLPFFVHRETLDIKNGTDRYYLLYEPVKNIRLIIDSKELPYADMDNLYMEQRVCVYSFQTNSLFLSCVPDRDVTAQIAYMYIKTLKDEKCFLELPEKYMEALRVLFMSKIHEKPTRNTKERNLSTHYIKLYDRELQDLKVNKKARPKGLRTRYQVI